ncbi:MAG: cell division protein FtsW, partial [Eubacterium sp.]|nr:cell division protein FtsW [Candidatus Colimonas fimequi]
MEHTQETQTTTESKRQVTLNKKSRLGAGDFPLMIITLILVVFGVIMVFSSSYYDSISRNYTPYHFLVRQIIWVCGGSLFFFVGAMVDYRFWRKVAPWAAILGLVLLCLLFTPMGHSINNATRWLKVGPVTVMPGEIAKLCAIMFTAWYLSEKPNRIRSLLYGVIPVVALGGIYGVLIIKQPNMSTAITVVGIVGCIMIVAGLQKRYIMLAVGAIVAFVFSLNTVLRGTYWYDRFASFQDPFADPLGDGYQVVQSLLGIGSGGLFGVGLGKSVQKSLYLPEPQNDFILAIIGEELGFVGIMILMLVYAAFIWRGVHIALNARDQFGLLLASGVVLMEGIQVLLNLAVLTSSMPPKGINLPLISYGGNGI